MSAPNDGGQTPSLPAQTRSPLASFDGQQNFSVHVDEGVLGGISVSPTNRDAVIVGRRGLLIIDLENPFEDPRLLPYETPNNAWRRQLNSAVQVQWCPHPSKVSYIASTFNHSVFIWNLDSASGLPSTTSSPSITPPSTPKGGLSLLAAPPSPLPFAQSLQHHPQKLNILSSASLQRHFLHLGTNIGTSTFTGTQRLAASESVDYTKSSSGTNVETALTAHTRTVTNMDWSLCQPDTLATCALDPYIYMWDTRKPSRPVNALSSWHGGTTQVKWNPKNTWILASTHNDKIFLWDIRKGSVPLTIDAHTSKILNIAWSHANENELVSSSKDRLVKFWNMIEPERCQDVIEGNTPIWRTRYTPFGLGIAVVSQHQENPSVIFWNRSDLIQPAFELTGPSSGVVEMDWRLSTSDDGHVKHQMLTWSREKVLQLWTLDDAQTQSFGDNTSPVWSALGDQAPSPLISHSEEMYGSPLALNTHKGKRVRSYRDHSHRYQNPRALKHLLNLRASRSSPFLSSSSSLLFSASTNSTVNPETTHRMVHRDKVNDSNNSLSVQHDGGLQRSELSVQSTHDRHQHREALLLRNLKEEIVWISGRYGDIKFDKVDISNRTCSILLYGPWGIDSKDMLIRANFKFPERYPDMYDTPTFELPLQLELSAQVRHDMYQNVNDIIERSISKGRPCLETCIRYLLGQTQHRQLPYQVNSQPENNGSAMSVSHVSTQNDFSPEDDVNESSDNGSTDEVNEEERNTDPLLLEGQQQKLHRSSYKHDAEQRLRNSGGVLRYKTGMHRHGDKSDGTHLFTRNIAGKSDENVPFPRLCSAVWSGNGTLAYFFSSFTSAWKTAQPVSSENQVLQQNITTHPRSYKLFDLFRRQVETLVTDNHIRNSTNMNSTSMAMNAISATDSNVTGMHTSSGNESSDNDTDEGNELLQTPTLFFNPPKLPPISQQEDIIDRFRQRILRSASIKGMGSLGVKIPLRKRSSSAAKMFVGSVPLVGSGNAMRGRDLGSLSTDTSVSDLFLKVGHSKARTTAGKLVYLQDLSALLPVSQELARAYAICGSDSAAICRKYTAIAKEFGRTDLVELWSLVEMILAHPQDRPGPRDSVMRRRVPRYEQQSQTIQWGLHPFGRGCVDQLLHHYERIGDVQTLAMLTCVLADPFSPADETRNEHIPTVSHMNPDISTSFIIATLTVPTQVSVSVPITTPVSTTNTPKTKENAIVQDATTKAIVPNQVSNMNIMFNPVIIGSKERNGPTETTHSVQHVIVRRSNRYDNDFDSERTPTRIPLLDSRKQKVYDAYKLAYCELLFRWELLEHRASILKFVKSSRVQPYEFESGLYIRCPQCSLDAPAGSQCTSCKRVRLLRCEICHIHVRGLALFCPGCGHGGHEHHLQEWFIAAGKKVCAVGSCKCRCAAIMVF